MCALNFMVVETLWIATIGRFHRLGTMDVKIYTTFHGNVS